MTKRVALFGSNIFVILEHQINMPDALILA